MSQARSLYPVLRPLPETERGVFELEGRGSGLRTFEVVATGGEWLRTVSAPTNRVTTELVDGLWDLLEAEDPTPVKVHLRVLR